MSDPVGELIAEYAYEAALRDDVKLARAEVEAARAAVVAAEHRVARAKEDRGMKRARLTHAVARLARLTGAVV